MSVCWAQRRNPSCPAHFPAAPSTGNRSSQINGEAPRVLHEASMQQHTCWTQSMRKAYFLVKRSTELPLLLLSHHMGLDEVLSSLAKYCTKDGLWEGNMVVEPEQICIYWWKGLCGFEALAPVASIILSQQHLPPLSATGHCLGTRTQMVRKRLTKARVENCLKFVLKLPMETFRKCPAPLQPWSEVRALKMRTCYWMLLTV